MDYDVSRTIAKDKAKKVEYPYNMIYVMFEGNVEKADYLYKKYYHKINDFEASVEYVLYTLTPRERFVLEHRFKELKTYEEIGKLLNVGRTRIPQIMWKALRKLREPKRFKYLEYTVSGVIDEIRNECNSKIQTFYEKFKETQDDIDSIKVNKFIPVYVKDMDLSCRAYNCLIRHNVKMITDLIDLTYEDLLTIRNLGKYTADEIVKKLDMYGYHLKESEHINV